MNEQTMEDIINYVSEKEKLAWESKQLAGTLEPKPVNHYNPATVAMLLGVIATRLERLVADGLHITPKAALDAAAANPPLRIPVVSMPGRAALAYRGVDAGLPHLNAAIETCRKVDGGEFQECVIYIGNEVLADTAIFRGKKFAIKMMRGALKGAMSCLGKHRRLTANRAKRRATKEVA